MCRQKLQSLAEAGMIELIEDEGRAIRPLQLGYLMARFCVELETMRLFRKMPINCGEAEVLELLSSSTEFEAGIVLRHNEKKALAAINASEEKIRYPIDGSRKAKCKTAVSKAFLLLQLRVGGLPLEGFEDVKPLLIEKGSRILRAMVEYAETQRLCNVLIAAVRLHKALLTGAGWHDSVTAQFQQFAGVGVHFAARLSEASGGSLLSFAQLTSLKVEQIMPKGPAVLAEARTLLRSALRFDAGVETPGVTSRVPASAPIRVAVHVRSTSPPMPFAPMQAVPDSKWRLLVASADGQLLLTRKLSSVDVSKGQGLLSFSLSVPPQNAKHHLAAHLVNEHSFGLDSSGQIELPGATGTMVMSPVEGASASVPNRRNATATKGTDGDRSDTATPSQTRGSAQHRGGATAPFDILAALDVCDSDEDLAGSDHAGIDLPHHLDADQNPDADLFGETPFIQPSQVWAAGAPAAGAPSSAREGKRPAAPKDAALCNHTCKDKTACGHLCCKDGKVQKNRGREKAPGRGAGARSHKSTPPPKPDPRASAFFDRFRAPQPRAATPKSKPSPQPAAEDGAGLDFSSDAIAVRDGNASATSAMPVAGGRPAHGGGKPHSTGAGGRHMEHLQAMARSVPSTPVRRLPIPPLPEAVEPARSPATMVAPRESGGATLALKPVARVREPKQYPDLQYEPRQPQHDMQRLQTPQQPQQTPHPLQSQFQAQPKAPQQLFQAWQSQKPVGPTAGRQSLPSQKYHPLFQTHEPHAEARYVVPSYSRPPAASAAQSFHGIIEPSAPGHACRARCTESEASTVEHEADRQMLSATADAMARHGAPSSNAAGAAAQYLMPDSMHEMCARPSISFGHGKQLSRGVLDWLGDDAPQDEASKRARHTSPKKPSPPKKPAKESMANLAHLVLSGPFRAVARHHVQSGTASAGLVSRNMAEPRGEMSQPYPGYDVPLPMSLSCQRSSDGETPPSAGRQGLPPARAHASADASRLPRTAMSWPTWSSAKVQE